MSDIGCVPVNMGSTIMSKKESNYFIKYIRIFLWAWILSGFILLMDIYNMPSSVINKIPMEARIIFVAIFVVAFKNAFPSEKRLRPRKNCGILSTEKRIPRIMTHVVLGT